MAQDFKKQYQQIDQYITNSDNIPEDYFDSLLKAYPNEGYLIGMKAYNLIIHDQINEAEDFLKKYENKNTFILMSKAYLAEKKDDKKNTFQLYQKALSIDETKENKWIRLLLYYYYKDISDEQNAWYFLEESLKIDPKFTSALIEKAYSLDQIINCREIISIMEEVIKTYKNSDILIYLANAYYNCNNIQKARIFIDESLVLNQNADAYYLLGHIDHNNNNNLDSALINYKKSLDIDSLNPIVWNSLAWLYYDLGHMDKAEECFYKLINIDSSDEPFVQAINFFILSKQVNKARELNNLSAKINGNSFFTDGYDIILKLISSPTDTQINTDLIEKFEKKYGEFEVDWLNKTAKDLGITR